MTESLDAPPPGSESCASISNEFFQVRLEEGGTLCITDRGTGEKFDNLGFLEDEGDGGDTYNFSSLPGDSALYHRA